MKGGGLGFVMGRAGCRGFEDEHVQAAVTEETIGAVPAPQGTDHALEGVTENAPEGRSLVFREEGLIPKGTGETVLSVTHFATSRGATGRKKRTFPSNQSTQSRKKPRKEL
jgi:hypothetical protein